MINMIIIVMLGKHIFKYINETYLNIYNVNKHI